MFSVIAGIASIIGLAVSILTLRVAAGAKKAANQAREAVRRDSAAEEFRNLSRVATEFLGHIEADQMVAATLRARDLISATTLASNRWERFISPDSKKSINEASSQVSVISRSLSTTVAPLTPQQKDKLLRICHGVVGAITTEAGKLFSDVEAGGVNARRK